MDTEENSDGVVAVGQVGLQVFQRHGERAAHDGVEQVVCSRARHDEKFTDEKIFTARIVEEGIVLAAEERLERIPLLSTLGSVGHQDGGLELGR